MYKSLERTIMEMGKPKAQLDEIEIRKSDFLAHEAGKMSMDDLMKKYASQDRRRGNALRGAIQGELRLMRDHQKNNKAVFDRMEEVEVQEGGHEDVVSAKNKVKIAMSALQKMQGELNKLGDDADLPSWWMGKVAIAVDKLDGMADYLDTQVEDKDLENVAKKLKGASKTHSKQADTIMKHVKDMEKIDEGMMKNIAIDLKDMPADEFQRKYNMSKADAMKKFGAPEETELTEEPNMAQVLKVMGPTKNAVEGVKAIQKAFKVNDKKAKDLLDKAIKHALGEETKLDEVSTDMINRYYKMSQQSRDKAVNSAIATILRKGDHSKDLNTRRKREAGMKMAKSRAVARLRGEEIEEKTLTPAEKKKREEIAQAIERDNPDMPMDKKMAIATATAKKVAEDVQTEPATNTSLFHNYIQKLVKGEA